MLENSLRTVAMKKALREKFKQNVNFVRPLYRKAKLGKRVKPIRKVFITVDVNQDNKPCGNGIYVKRNIVKDNTFDCHVIDLSSENGACNNNLPGACDSIYQKTHSRFKSSRNVNNINRKFIKNAEFTGYKLSRIDYGKMESHKDFDRQDHDQSIQAKSNVVLIHKIPVSWLRVYPATQSHDESILSVVFRCVACQLGLAGFLILWTVMWMFIVHHFEGPYETQVSLDFEKAQNQLVIDLATELRQITPLSPKWKFAIEQRLEDERRLTIEAVGRGAKLHPGQFWDLSGTFLFNIYVMTALGFGAPVPHTVWGRTSALIYAALAVPVHIFLMVNASTCIVINMEKYVKRCKNKLCDKEAPINGRSVADNKASPNYSKNSQLTKNSCKAICLRRKLARILSILYLGRCVPAATVLYYTTGVIAFGVARGRSSLEAALFPLEFTTTGGLEHVEGIVRIIYGLYVEGAMSLLACALAALRAHSGSTIHHVADKHRLFSVHYTS